MEPVQQILHPILSPQPQPILSPQPPQISNEGIILSTSVSPAPASAVSSTSNVVTIPVPICAPEDIYTYVAVKGSLHDTNASIFGLNREEKLALSKRFTSGQIEIVNGIMVKGAPMDVVNCLSKLGYKVICSTGEAEIVWTMQREI